MTRGLAVLAILPIALLPALPAAAELDHNLVHDGIQTGATKTVLSRDNKRKQVKAGAPVTPVFEFQSVVACANNSPDTDSEVMCMGATQACAGNTPQQGQGPMVRLYRRTLDKNGTAATGWKMVGRSCLVGLVPAKPVVGMANILAAFHKTPWAKPTVHIQPEHNVTLVTLPTYFEVNWPTAGFQPGEIDTVTLLGTRVQIRPTVSSYTYNFGDGTSDGPTTSPGGIYPDGDIRHAYPKPGKYTTRITITYGGEYRVGGGAWTSIPATVPIAGSPQILTVKTAHARLVTR